ncbi:ABC transporter substrate-binding protein [Pollutimonas bauzanensis]|uniref:Substrate-binding protein n=1 Tax=Pollutimonas bauzanensis TaxID=658167 RepID=A0A1M5Y8B7_9BURK|nr:ABC transporter substrate-binding protein [Pollutimonas bauzanensis]SHI08331.1 substrate-binding protein [Pollutimonas bauzanensis]
MATRYQCYLHVAMFALLVLGIGSRAFLPSVIRASQEQEKGAHIVLPIRHAMFGGAMPPDAFVTLDDSTEHVDSVQQYNLQGEIGGWLLRKVYPSLTKIETSGWGAQLDPEIVMLRQPDVIFSWKGRDSALLAMGFPQLVELESSRGKQVESHLKWWALFGRMLGKQDKARQLSQRYTRQLAALKHEIVQAHHPSVLLIVGGYDAGFWLPTNHHYDERFIQLNAKPLHKGLFGGKATLENVLMLDPDVIFLDTSAIGDQLVPAQLYVQPEWQAVRAVRGKRVYRMPDLPHFSIPVEDPIRLQWLAEILYPQVMPATIRQEVVATILAAYDYRMSENDIDTLLNLQANQASQNYQRFFRSENKYVENAQHHRHRYPCQ